MLNALAIGNPKAALILLVGVIVSYAIGKPLFSLFGSQVSQDQDIEEEKKLAP